MKFTYENNTKNTSKAKRVEWTTTTDFWWNKIVRREMEEKKTIVRRFRGDCYRAESNIFRYCVSLRQSSESRNQDKGQFYWPFNINYSHARCLINKTKKNHNRISLTGLKDSAEHSKILSISWTEEEERGKRRKQQKPQIYFFCTDNAH